MKKAFTFLGALFLAGCVEVETTQPQPKPQQPTPVAKEKIVLRDYKIGLASFNRVKRRIEPVAENVCRQFSKDLKPIFCDFKIVVDSNTKAPPNAYQTIDKTGRPIIAFNYNMLRALKNDDELGFIMGHEAGHQIARHLLQKRENATRGAVIGGILAGVTGIDVNSGAQLGAQIGAQRYSQRFELQADRIGTHIAARTGYNAFVGAAAFPRIAGNSNSPFSTHPPSAERVQTVRQTASAINAARARGQTLPVTW